MNSPPTEISRRVGLNPAARVIGGAPKGPVQEKGLAYLTGVIMWLMIVMMTIPGDLDFYSKRVLLGGGDANPLTRTLWLAVFAISIAIVFSRISLIRRLLRRVNPFFILFLVLAATSILWSIDPQQTVIRVIRMTIVCSACLAVAVAGWHPRRFQQLIRGPVTILLFGSIIFCLVRPDLAIHHETNSELLNAWHGLFATKNGLGAVAAYGVLFWAHAWISRETARLRALIAACAAFVCLVMSRSDTSMIATILSVMALFLLMRAPGSMRRSMRYLATALIILILLYSMAMLKVIPGLDILLSPIPMITGKDLTFSHRAEIWAAVVDHVQLRPIFGSGYSAYWTMGRPGPDMESYAVMSKLDGFYPGSSHNGYLQILNDLGAVGLIILLGYLAVYFRQSIRLYGIDRNQGALFLALLLQQATINLSEPLWLNVLLVDFIVMTTATTCLARSLVDDKNGYPPAAGAVGYSRPLRVLRTSSQRAGKLKRLFSPPNPRTRHS